MNYKDLRKEYPEFAYKSFSWDLQSQDLVCVYNISAGEYTFHPKLIFKNINSGQIDVVKDSIDNLVFNIGLVEVLSYWKAFVSPKIIIECGSLDAYQTEWWKDLLINGMGQFFYENNIDFTEDNFISFISTQDSQNKNKKVNISSDSILVPVGGGKDSSVTLEILNTNFKNVVAFLLNPSIAAKETVRVAGVEAVV